MKLHYAGQPGEGCGWGICNANLRRELAKLCTLTENTIEADAVFMPLADHDFTPASRGSMSFSKRCRKQGKGGASKTTERTVTMLTMIAHLGAPHMHAEHVIGFLLAMLAIGVVGMIVQRKEK